MKPSDWSGAVGETWAQEWRRTDRLFVAVDAALIDAATGIVSSDPGLRVLDIGCGAGSTTLALAARLPAPRITGIDISPAQIAAATARAAAMGLTGERSDIVGDPPPALRAAVAAANGWCAFLVADASRWAGSESFDLIVARHGLMFFDEPATALAHVRSLAAPGAPLVFSCFRDPALNPWASEQRALVGGAPVDPHAPGPFAFADRDRTAGLLALAGFADVHATPLDYHFVAGAGDDPLADALGFFSRIGPAAEALRGASEAERERVKQGMAAICTRYRDGDRIVFPAAAWIWSARA